MSLRIHSVKHIPQGNRKESTRNGVETVTTPQVLPARSRACLLAIGTPVRSLHPAPGPLDGRVLGAPRAQTGSRTAASASSVNAARHRPTARSSASADRPRSRENRNARIAFV